jgi:hypothetical protein
MYLQGKHLTRHGRFKSTLVSTHTDTAAHTYVHNLGQLHSLQAPETQLETNVSNLTHRVLSWAMVRFVVGCVVHNLGQQHSLQAPETQLETM